MSDAIVIGAGSAIGQAFARHLAAQGHKVWAVSRGTTGPETDGVESVHCAYREQEMEAFAERLRASGCKPAYVGIFLGILHDGALKPEKRIEDLKKSSLNQVLEVNTVLPALWLQHLLPLMNQGQTCRVAVLSARVGSISDNRLGGWYAYRASKAALNMLLKTAAIECARRAKGVKLVAFHPGTTDTPLSKPFQANVPAEKLFTPDFVAQQLFQVLQAQTPDGELSYLDYAGKPVPW